MTIQSDGTEASAISGWRILDRKWDGFSTFTVDEAAEILRVSRCSAYAAAKNGEIPTVQVGRRLVVPRYAIERKLAGVAA
jgi:excisionase family DNA binding protein